MRYPASEKLEIIRLVEGSHLPAKRTLEKLGIPRSTFHRWYARWQAFGEAGLEDRRPHPGRVWNRIPDDVRQAVVTLALDEPELAVRELAVRFTDTKKHFVSEASVHRILKAHDLIASPAFIVVKAANEFHHKTTRPNQLWQTDFTYLKVVGWGWCYLSARQCLSDHWRSIGSPSTTSAATWWRGSSAPPCGRRTSPTRCTSRWQPRAAMAPRSCTAHGCSATTARPASPATSPPS